MGSEPTTHLDLFAGIGGFSLAASWAGFTTVQHVEIEPFCQRVLAKNFPGVPCHGDIRTYDATQLMGRVSLVTGGFPCQDISPAGKGVGIEGERSGLWREMLRVVRTCRPLFVLAENSDRLRTRGADRVLSDLEGIGYHAGAYVVGAGNAGAPHLRKRAFVLASDPARVRRHEEPALALPFGHPRSLGASPCPWVAPDAGGFGHGREKGEVRAGRIGALVDRWRLCEPPVPGVDAGLPDRVDRVRALGNAVVPQVAYVFLKAIADQLASSPSKEETAI